MHHQVPAPPSDVFLHQFACFLWFPERQFSYRKVDVKSRAKRNWCLNWQEIPLVSCCCSKNGSISLSAPRGGVRGGCCDREEFDLSSVGGDMQHFNRKWEAKLESSFSDLLTERQFEWQIVSEEFLTHQHGDRSELLLSRHFGRYDAGFPLTLFEESAHPEQAGQVPHLG